MAVTAQTGVLSFGGQSGKGSVASTFYKHRAANVDLSTISDDRLGPPEVGGDPVPTIPYRAGVLVTGGATVYPRLENTLGWLLYGSLGHHTVETDKNVFDTTTTGMYKHTFLFHTDQSYVPYMSFRKATPATDSTNVFGETFQDCKIVSLTLALPNDGLISSRIDMLGRLSEFTNNPSWTYGNTQYEDYESIPIGVVSGGYMQIPDFSASDLPITAANVTIANAPLDIRQERVYGDPYIEDVTTVGRALTVELVVKWKDPQLYRKIFTGATNGTQWQPAPFVADLDIYGLSPTNASGTNPATPWQIRVQAPSVMYQVNGGIQLAGNQSVMFAVTGTAIASTENYATIKVGNLATNYTWPS